MAIGHGHISNVLRHVDDVREVLRQCLLVIVLLEY